MAILHNGLNMYGHIAIGGNRARCRASASSGESTKQCSFGCVKCRVNSVKGWFDLVITAGTERFEQEVLRLRWTPFRNIRTMGIGLSAVSIQAGKRYFIKGISRCELYRWVVIGARIRAATLKF